MMRLIRKKSWLVGAVTAVWASTVLCGTAQARSLKAGDRMPNFTLRDINGKTVNLAGFKNKAVWITFFHST